MGTRARCTIVVPVYNGLSYLIDCLESVFSHTAPELLELLIVDDASDPETAAYIGRVASKHTCVDVLRNQANTGFLKSCNRAIEATSTEFVLLLNSDVVVTPGWLERMLACIDSDPRIASANPLTNRAARIDLPMLPGTSFRSMDWLVSSRPRPEYPDIVTGVGFCMLLRRQALDEVGVFDTVYGHGYCEESDLCMRLTSRGWRTVIADNVYLYHRGSASFADRDDRYRNNRRIFDRRWKKEYRRQFRAFQRRDPLRPVRERLALPRRWHPRPAVWQAGRSLISSLRRKKPVDLALNALRGVRSVIASAEPIVHAGDVENATEPGRLRVTYVVPNLVIAGGVLSVIQLVNELVLRGVETRIATLFVDPLVNEWIRLYSRPMVYRSAGELIEQVPESDIVVATRWDSVDWVTRIAQAGRAARQAYFIQDYEAWFFSDDDNKSREKVQSTYRLIENRIVKSDWLAGMLESDGFSSRKIRLGMDLGRFYPRPTQRSKPAVVAMARPGTCYRGFDTLVAVLFQLKKRIPELEIILFGARNLKRRSLPFEFRDQGVVHDQERLARIYSGADVFLDTSDFQGFGRCALEAMACGTACVLSGAGGVNEYAVHDRNALLVTARDVDGFVQSVAKLLDDASLRNRLVESARRTASMFSHKREAADTLEYFKSLAHE